VLAPKEVQDDPSLSLPVLFERLITLYAEDKSIRGLFGIVYLDFGGHNLLVDTSFNILAVIAFDGVIAGPIKLQAQFPTLMGLDVEPPFHVEIRLIVIERINFAKPKLEEYKRVV
jgi:hypothetical protein